MLGDRHPIDLFNLDALIETSTWTGCGTIKSAVFDDEAGPVFTVAHVLLTVHTI
jgi:hypothetical protein